VSFEALLWATNDAPIADVNEFAVLTMLAEKADPDGCNAFPSRTTMASRTHIDPKTVLRTLQRLESRGLISKGDQGAAAYLRADRRPVVYDLLIPFDWFPNIERINKERRDRGRPPLTPQERPGIAAPPEKTRRSDLGKERLRKDTNPRGDSEVPRDEVHGVTVSPERGDSESGTGGLRVTRTSPLNLSPEPPLPFRPSVDQVTRTRETDGRPVTTKEREQQAPAPAAVRSTPGVELLRGIAARDVRYTLGTAALRDQAIAVDGLLASGWTADRIVQMVTGRPLPEKVERSVGAIVSARLREAMASAPFPAPRSAPGGPAGGPTARCPQHTSTALPCGLCAASGTAPQDIDDTTAGVALRQAFRARRQPSGQTPGRDEAGLPGGGAQSATLPAGNWL
jgi:hypothetical protein